MATYQLFEGKSSLPLNGPNKPETKFKEGDTVETDLPLDEMWPHKWAKVTDDAPAKARGTKSKAPKAPKAAAAKAKAPAPEPEAEDDAEELDGDDVTDDFDLAKDNDLKVMHVTGTGYTIYDGKNAVNQEPVRTKTQAIARIKEHVGDKE